MTDFEIASALTESEKSYEGVVAAAVEVAVEVPVEVAGGGGEADAALVAG